MRKKEIDLQSLVEKTFNTIVDELSAREGTGKVFGRPRRLAQERFLGEMNKCEQAQ